MKKIKTHFKMWYILYVATIIIAIVPNVSTYTHEQITSNFYTSLLVIAGILLLFKLTVHSILRRRLAIQKLNNANFKNITKIS